jgi:putative hydrolase of the HAD superfamily
MPKDSFRHVDMWVFDLDNTLYPPSARLFDQIEERMTAFIMRHIGVDRSAANTMRDRYWRDYGTTLAGLMREHDLTPNLFLDEVHDISFDSLRADPALADRIKALPGRKIVYTNGHYPYALEVLKARGLSGAFDAVYSLEHADYRPKPEAEAFAQVFKKADVAPKRAAMFEDDPRNLMVPHALGLRTVHVTPTPTPAPHIHHHTDDLSSFLTQLLD